jgi:hypothetical protein
MIWLTAISSLSLGEANSLAPALLETHKVFIAAEAAPKAQHPPHAP